MIKIEKVTKLGQREYRFSYLLWWCSVVDRSISDQIYSFGHSDPKDESHPELLGHVQRVSFCCMRVGTFAEKTPGGPRDEPAVASRKDDGGPCSQVLPPTLNNVVRPHDGAAWSRAAGLQGRGIWWQTWYWSAPLTLRRPPVICSPPFAGHLLRFAFELSSCCAMLFYYVSLDRERNHKYILQIEKTG
jgi:hypothetical protein